MANPVPHMTTSPSDRRSALADPALRKSLADMARRKLPESEVDDVVQATLIEALASTTAPDESDALKRWVFGIARHKVADYHRKSRRESPTSEPPEVATDGEPHSARDMLRWAEGELPKGDGAEETLHWLLREGEGEKLESIAASEKLPAPRVRQRVVRLRKHFRERWAAELAAVVAAAIAIGVMLWLWKRKEPEIPIARDVPSTTPAPEKMGPQEIRKLAFEQCAAQSWNDCLQNLDRAKTIDPVGDQSDDVTAARKTAGDALNPAPIPSASTTPINAPTEKTAPTLAPNPKMTTPAPTSMAPIQQSTTPAPANSAAPDATSLGVTKASPKGKSGKAKPSYSGTGSGASDFDTTSEAKSPSKKSK